MPSSLAQQLARGIPSRFKFEENIGARPARERSDYYRAQHMANLLWSQLGPRYFPGQAQPTLDFQTGFPDAPGIGGGQYDPATRMVALTGGAISRLAGHGGGRPFTPVASVLAHEWAHRFQDMPAGQALQASRDLSGRERLREGGAVGFTRATVPQALRRLGWRGPLDSESADYLAAALAARKKYGAGWFTSGQFGR